MPDSFFSGDAGPGSAVPAPFTRIQLPASLRPDLLRTPKKDSPDVVLRTGSGSAAEFSALHFYCFTPFIRAGI